LKSLRARAGLRSDRLSDSDPAVGVLSGLVLVKELTGTGVPTGQAIVEVVTNAAKTLEPTDSIVADMSLALELSAPDMADSGLYANDLGKRRLALIEHWERVHALRSAPDPGQAPTLRTLRLDVEATALTALAVALTMTNPATASGPPFAASSWPGGSVVANGAAPHDEAHADAPPRLLRSATPLLLGELRSIADALRGAMWVDDGGRGWPHDLRKGSHPHTALATSYALKALLLIDGFLTADLKDVVERLGNAGVKPGGYKARSQKEPRPEGTAAVLSTLHRIDGTGTLHQAGGTADLEKRLAAVKESLGPFERTRPFILSTILETSAQLGYDPDLTRSLTADLLAARQEFSPLLLWPEKSEKELFAPFPSVAHTARAIRALAVAQAARAPGQERTALDDEAAEAMDQAAAWLAEQNDLGNVSEVIDRQTDDGDESSYVRHFTAAWVVKALVSVGLPASHPSVSGAVAQIWNYYDPQLALWKWTNGDLPVWMTLDAVEALRLAALATTIPLGGLHSSRSAL
jgi:hypothetical protein